MTREEAKQKAHEQVLFKGSLGSLGECTDPEYLDALTVEVYRWLREIAEEQALQMKRARLHAEVFVDVEDEIAKPTCQHTLGKCPECTHEWGT